MLQDPSGLRCLVTEPGQGGGQVSLLLSPHPPQTRRYPAAGPRLPGEALGSTSFLLKRVGGERRHENECGGGRLSAQHSQPPVSTQAGHFQGIFDNSFRNR